MRKIRKGPKPMGIVNLNHIQNDLLKIEIIQEFVRNFVNSHTECWQILKQNRMHEKHF